MQASRRLLAASILAGLPAPALAQRIELPPHPAAQVTWAAEELRATLVRQGMRDAEVRVAIARPKDALAEQSFTIRRDGRIVTIAGGGPAGANYGLLELVERAGEARDWTAFVAALPPIRQSPWVEVRADNAFLHLKPFILNDLPMWRGYLDMLARNRFNMLDLHGIYDLPTTDFVNIFPALVDVPGYPKTGNHADQARNLASLKAVVAYAESRGIRVGLMNYAFREKPRPTQAGAPQTISGVAPDQLADYTARATAELIRQVPQLHELGFRVGETGQDADFFKNAYLRGLEIAGRKDLRLYTRSWLTKQAELDPIAAAAPGRFDIEIKYNGEHLGLPYQAMQERFATYSYEHYLNKPANYGILWQVRSNGTHRYWSWANTDFIRQTVRTFRLGDARGFTLEPPFSYFSAYNRDYYQAPADQRAFQYSWQKNWMWYLAWGRLGYDPELPEDVLIRAWQAHYGAAGAPAYQAMQAASRIVPLTYAYRFIGADHRDYSPETETGYTDNSDTVVGVRTPVPLSIQQYGQDHTEDDRSFVNVSDFVRNKIEGITDGRYGPFAVAGRLRAASQATADALAAMPPVDPAQAAEWRLLKTDLLAAGQLGAYHADRIEGLTWLDHAVRANQPADFAHAKTLLASSRAHWRALAEVADPVYAPLQNTLRAQTDFKWASQSPVLDRIDATADQLWTARPKSGVKGKLLLTETDTGGTAGLALATAPEARIARDGGSVSFAAAPSSTQPLARVVLWWKPLPSDAHWRAQEMVRDGQLWRAQVPFTKEGLMYATELQDTAGNARSFPLQAETRPFWILDPQ